MRSDDLIILDGGTFFYSCANGDVVTGNSQGLFYRDVRHISHWSLRLNGDELDSLTSRRDVMEAEADGNGSGRHWQETGARSVTLWNDREGYRRGTLISFNRKGRVTKERATFRLKLRPQEV